MVRRCLVLLLLLVIPAWAEPVPVGFVEDPPHLEVAREVWSAAAERAGISWTAVPFDSQKAALAAFEEGRVVGALEVEPEQAASASYHYRVPELGLATVAGHEGLWKVLTSGRVIFFGVFTLGLLVVFSGLVWWAERRHEDPEIRGPLWGLWFTLMTLTTVGYGDTSVKTGRGRWVAAFLLVFTIAFQILASALLTSSLTAAALSKQEYRTPEHLRQQRVGIVGGSVAELALDDYGATFQRYESLGKALVGLQRGEVSFVAAPMLELELATAGTPEKFSVSRAFLPLGTRHFLLAPELRHRVDPHLVSLARENYVERVRGRLLSRQ